MKSVKGYRLGEDPAGCTITSARCSIRNSGSGTATRPPSERVTNQDILVRVRVDCL
jgi:hypothetical protein